MSGIVNLNRITASQLSQARGRRGRLLGIRASLVLGSWLALLLLLVPFRCTRFSDPFLDYSRVLQLFEHGYLANSQEQAAQGYQRFLSTHPEWASRFLLLEAESMVWRGLNPEALRLLAVHPSSFFQAEWGIKKAALESVALVREQHLSAASQKLVAPAALCSKTAFSTCGAVTRAQGIISLTQGNFADAKGSFLKGLTLARAQHDRIDETTLLLYLGVVSTQSEQYDEALDWNRSAYRLAVEAGQEDLAQVASGNLGWTFFKLGDPERALDLLIEAGKIAARLGDDRAVIKWTTTIGYVYMDLGKFSMATNAYQRALQSARKIDSKEDEESILIDLAQVVIEAGNADEADSYLKKALTMVDESGDKDDRYDILATQVQAAALRGDQAGAEKLLHEVEAAPESQTSMRWTSELALAKLHEQQGEMTAARNSYRAALATFEAAREQVRNEDSQLPFLTNATRIYDDYIHFLITQGKTDEALMLADQSRARTLAQGLSGSTASVNPRNGALHATAVARRSGSTLLFYWLGEKQSYLWAVTPAGTKLFTLPARTEIAAQVEHYRKALLEPANARGAFSEAGESLYRTLVEPAASLISPNGNVAIVCDGPLSLLNFETLTVPGATPHYWIEDANIVSAPSLSMLAAARPPRAQTRRLLLMGDAVSPNADYPDLPKAAQEMRAIQQHFHPADQTVFSRAAATSDAYTQSAPGQYSYIHFVAHGVASRTEPLDSAIILSRTSTAEDSFKLHAREIIHHPLDARLVTISACYGGGTRSYAGEGLVGLSWAFLRAGAHNVIGALWEASDDSTPQLMDSMYAGIEKGMTPSVALRNAKLALLHSDTRFRDPFYWAPFQIYAGL